MKLQICYPCNPPFPISQKWGENAQYYNTIGMKGHNGWDFGVPTGTPIYATHDGIVWFAGMDGTMSNTVMIISDLFDYKDSQVQFKTAYAHLSEYFVTPGQKVKKGDKIALSGNTGRYTTGAHLHFGIHPVLNYADVEAGNGYNGCIDPAPYFDGSYPNSSKTELPVHFIAFQKALNDFQSKEGLKPYDLVGNGTKKALNKYLTIKYDLNNTKN
jgi:murein DD-endopeptidase MepM/ murein hydrolase activator NlpD